MLIEMIIVVSDDLSSDFSFPASLFLLALVAALLGTALRGVVEFSWKTCFCMLRAMNVLVGVTLRVTKIAFPKK